MIQHYDRGLRQLGSQHSDLSEWTDYLRTCQHERSQFLGQVLLLLMGSVAQLRTEPTNKELIQRMSRARPALQTLISQFKVELSEVEESYKSLFLPHQSANESLTRVLA